MSRAGWLCCDWDEGPGPADGAQGIPAAPLWPQGNQVREQSRRTHGPRHRQG